MSTPTLRFPEIARESRHRGPLDHVQPVTPRILLSINEAAASLGIGRTLMYELLSSGQVESVYVGRLHRVPADALAAFVAMLRSEGQRDSSTSPPLPVPVHSTDDSQR